MISKKIILLLILLIALTIFLVEEEKIYNNDFVVEEFGYINVLFCPKNNCTNELNNLILNSNKSKCAFFDLENKILIETFRNKKTEILIDEDNYNNFGIKIKSTGLMHNKFCIIDEKIVWTGSFNPTKEENHNNVIILESQTISKNYLKEFDEIKLGNSDETKITNILFNNFTLKNYFCPEDDCQEKIVEELEKAEESILFLTFTFTDEEIAQILVDKSKEGKQVKGLMESFQNHKYSVLEFLRNNNVEVKLDNESVLLHNKLFIIDNQTIITGSYNPTKAANTKNDENILVISETRIVNKYLEYFNTFI